MQTTLKLPTDRYAFPIVTTMDELEIASKAGRFTVKVVCPECGKEMLKTIGAAGFVIIYKCKQHD